MSNERLIQTDLVPIPDGERSIGKFFKELAAESGGEYQPQPTTAHDEARIRSLREIIKREYPSKIDRVEAAVDIHLSSQEEYRNYLLTLQEQERGRKLRKELQENPKIISNGLLQSMVLGGRWGDRFTLRDDYIEILSLLPGARNRFRINWSELTDQRIFTITENPPRWADFLTKVYNRLTGKDLKVNFGTLELHPTQNMDDTLAKITTNDIQGTRELIENTARRIDMCDKEIPEPKPIIDVGDLIEAEDIK